MSYTVAVLGACGGIGQPLCLLLKTHMDLIGQINLYDMKDPIGVKEDLSHIPNKIVIKSFKSDKLKEALTGVHAVVICAGIMSSKINSRKDFLSKNSSIIKSLIEEIGQHCPQAIVAILSNPVNSLVPLAVTALSNKGIDASKRVIGITSLDVLRASTFMAWKIGCDPKDIEGICICGHSENTIVPLINNSSMSTDEINELCLKIRDAGMVVIEAKNRIGSATLSTALAAFKTLKAILRGLSGEKGVIECAYVKSDVTSCSYFASPVEFGPEGIHSVFLPDLNQQQQKMVDEALPHLKAEIQDGLDFFTQ